MAKRAKGPKPKHVPQRTCVACRGTSAKRELVRVVRTVNGEVEVDQTGKKAGRGAYVCRNRACWDIALKRRVLEHALQTTISSDSRAALEAYAQSVPEAEPEKPASESPAE